MAFKAQKQSANERNGVNKPIKRNWPELSRIGKENPFLMVVLAVVDTTSVTGRALKKAFPKCFEDVKGQFPLSVLMAECKKRGSDGDNIAWQWVTLGIIDDYGIPALIYSYDQEQFGGEDIPVDLANTVDRQKLQRAEMYGEKVKWNGQDFLIVENACGLVALVPMRCFDRVA